MIDGDLLHQSNCDSETDQENFEGKRVFFSSNQMASAK